MYINSDTTVTRIRKLQFYTENFFERSWRMEEKDLPCCYESARFWQVSN